MSWKNYTSYINKKVFFEILDNSFNCKKELILETKEAQGDVLKELRKHIESFNPENGNSWDLKFNILKEPLPTIDRNRYVNGEMILEHYSIFDSKTLEDYLIVQIKSSSYSRQEFYFVIFFKENRLHIEFPIHKKAYRGDKLEDLIIRFDKYKTTKEAIVEFVNTLMEKQKELEKQEENKKLKQKKITELKTKTIVAKVKDIMKEKHMTYRFIEKRNKTILIIKLSKSQVIEISITHKKFHNTLQKLSELIDKLVELYEQGIEVKHKQTNNTNYFTWIKN